MSRLYALSIALLLLLTSGVAAQTAPPELTPIGAQSVNENVNLNFGITATDADATTPVLSTSTLPTGATFTDNLDGTGTFNWTPSFAQSGVYPVTFYATDAVTADIDSEIVEITVTNVNQDPVLAAIGAQSVNENTLLTFNVSATDADATTPSFTTSTLPTGASFTDNLDGTGSFSWTPTFAQSGSYDITFRATDGVATDSEVVVITVNNVNQPPVLAPIGAQSTNENVNLTFNISATDADGATPSFTTSALPTGASFTDNLDGTGTFIWTPTLAQSGSYDVTFTASDGTDTDAELVAITVNNVNQDPVLAAIGPQAVNENTLLSIAVSASDADGQALTLTTSTLPTGATFTDNGDGTGSFGWTPTFAQSGSYNVTFRATDGVATDSEVVAITVNNVNQAPVLAAIGPRNVAENANLNFVVSASDADGTTPSFTTSALPTGATFTDNLDGTGTFDWTPTSAQSGSFDVTFTASDGTDTDAELVTITVTNVNQAPVLAAIGAKSVNENVNLNFVVSATDADGTTPSFTTSALPTGATFTDNLDGTGTFNWTPTFAQSGSYDITFTASDGTDTDAELVTITVTNVNQVPVLAAIGPKSVAENANLNFLISASDADGQAITLTTSALPTGATFTDNGNGTGTFDWTPTSAQGGSYDVTFTASDGTDTDAELVTITVTNVNLPPVLAAIGPQSVNENALLTFNVSATDADGTTPSFTTSALPTGASFIDNLDGTGTFNWTPTFAQSGSYDITFTASDGTDTDAELVTITVNNVNQAPVLSAIGPQSVNENVLLSFGVGATDGDGQAITLTTSTLPTGASFTDNGNGGGSFSWTPTFAQSGGYSVTFYATDGVATDSEVVAITVNNVNQVPVLAAIGPRSVAENANLNFVVSASDADGQAITLTTSALPTGATFTDNGNGTGTFNWTPTFAQSGSYDVTFTASDGTDSDAELVTITVNNVNQAPVLAAIGAKSVAENANLNFVVTAGDADGTIPVLTTSALPTGATFTDNGNGTGTFNWTPTLAQAGSYDVTFTASDGTDTDAELVTITVTNTNQAPILATIGPRSVNENANLNFVVSASDPDATTPTLSATGLPTGATFVDNGNGTGTFNWTPTFAQSGSYNVTFTASDGSLTDQEIVAITVTNVNRDPVLAAIGPRSVNENVNLSFGVSATDADGQALTLTTSTLPTGASFTDNGNGTGSFGWTPTFAQSGAYSVTFRATDGVATDSEVVVITVNNVNQDPILAAIGPRSVNENVLLNFSVSATDADGQALTLTTSTLPTGATFTDNGNGTGSFSWTPTFAQSGSYNVTFRATDGVATDSEVVAITVTNVNQPPILAAIGPRNVAENVNLNFSVTASDADGQAITLTTSALPTGATFTDNGNGTGTFNWTPTFAQSGSYNVTFTASDGTDTDAELVTITVTNTNQAPILATIGPRSVNENANLNFSVSATDADGTTPTLSATGLPTGATFVDNGNGTGTFNWTPTFAQSGSYNVTFTASDGSLTDQEIVAITVTNVNRDPILAAIGPKNTAENVNLNFSVTASDPDGATPILTTSTLPTGATFTDNNNGTGSFNWTPGFTQSGNFNVWFYATDGAFATAKDSELVSITVSNTNQAPILAAIGPRSVNENVALNFSVSAGDADGQALTLTTSILPTGATFTDNGNGTGGFNWTPTFVQSGLYSVTFYATDGVATDSEVVAVTVNEAGNQQPVLAAIGNKSITEGIALNFSVSSSDPESTPTLTTSILPTGATFTDNGDGTGAFSWTPGFTQAGMYLAMFYARDDSLAVDSELVQIFVLEAGNQAPVLATIGPKTTTENVLLNFAVTANDPDGTTPSLSATGLPTGATFTNNGNGTGTFNWTPGFTAAGTYNVTFTASDGTLTDQEIVAITVLESGNQAPVLATIGPKSVTEQVLLSFSVSATDADGQTPVLTTSALPTGATFTDNGNGTGSFSWIPGYTQSGTYNVTFTASDGALTDQEIVAITVNDAGNQAPVLAAIGPRSTTEQVQLQFTVTASDVDATTPTLSATNLPTGASFVDNADGTGTFTWTPGFAQAGVYNVTFTASDGSLTDQEIVAITVNDAGNQAPVLATIGPRSVTEGALLNFSVSASDADATTPTLSASPLPSGATFTDNGNGTGSFNWTPGFTQAGTYNVTFTASDGALTDQEVVTITVNEAGNQAPVLAGIGPQSGTEEILLNFAVSASDVDGTTPSLSATNLPTGAVFTDNGDGTGSFIWTPTFVQAGVYNVTFTASDGSLTDQEIVAITINDAGNQAPVLAAIGPRSATENVLLSFTVSASDADGTTPTLSTGTLPTGATFTDNGNGTGTFNWTPGFTQAGSYNVTFTASDGVLTDQEIVAITVNDAGNQAPVLAAIGPQSITEGLQLVVNASASDLDATIPALSASPLPSGAVFTDNGDGTGTLTWTPGFTQAGVYNVTFTASDGSLTDQEIVAITVNDAGNQAPVLAAIGPQSTTENVLLTFAVSASDPDATTPTLSATGLPTGATFVDNGNGTGTFNWTPGFTAAGVYNVTFTASDGVLTDQEVVAITVNDAGNQAPVLATIGPRSTTEEVQLLFTVTASDPDATIPALSATNLPTGAVFTDNGDGSGTFDWTPTFVQAGVYNVTFTASDGSLTDQEIVAITVGDAGNQAPILAAIGPQSATENVNLAFAVSATDPDGPIPALSTSTLPLGATFTDNGNGTGSFSWTPGYTQAGSYDVVFRASDGVAVDSETVTITVLDGGNQAPVLAAIGPRSTTEGTALIFGVSASDVDGTFPALTTDALPLGATFTDNGNGTGSFNWTPGFTQAGVYNITFTASDGALTDQEVVTITVNEAGNQAPVLATIGPRATSESTQLTFAISASDPDGTIPVLSATGLPTGATLTDNGDGTGTFDWTPGFTAAGTYNVTFAATDGTLSDQEIVTITVNDAGNQAPVLAAIGPRATTEQVQLLFVVTANDADGTIPALSATGLPTGATFTDNGDGTAVFNWTPGYTQAGSYNVTFTASDGSATDEEIVAITVTDAGNQAPVLNPIGAQETSEQLQLVFSVNSSDPDGTSPALTATNLPTGAAFTDNGDGTGTFNWTPGLTQAGSYDVTFTASDGTATDQEIVTITVLDVNSAPVLAAIGNQSVDEGVALNIPVSASDIDGDIPLLSTGTLPAGAIFTDNGNGTGSFAWTPGFAAAGVYTIRFYATDAIVPTAVDSEIVSIAVVNINRPPDLQPIGTRAINEGGTLSFTASATDPDGNFPIMTTSALPGTATYVDNGNGTGSFQWVTSFFDAGVYTVRFYATDGLVPSAVDSEVVTIIVGEAGNQPPQWTEINDTTVVEGGQLILTVSATDIEGNAISLSVNTTIPSNRYTFVDNQNGTGLFTYTPGYADAGLDSVRFIATDNAVPPLSSIMRVAVTTIDQNQPPQFMPAGPYVVDALDTLIFTVTAYDSTDPDNSRLYLGVMDLPANALFTDNGNNTGTFRFTPTLAQAGVDTVHFIAVDDDTPSQTGQLAVSVTVRSVNQTPVLAPIGSKKIAEGATLNINLSATDPEGTIPIFSMRNAPTNSALVDNGNGTATFTFTPSFIQAGLYSIEFRASDGKTYDKEVVTIQVTEAGDQAPYFTDVPAPSVTEGETLTDTVVAVDPDLNAVSLSTIEATVPPNFTFVDNGDGTGTFVFTPDFSQAGVFVVQVVATANDKADTADLVVTVLEFGNHPPTLALVTDKTTTELLPLVFTVNAVDIDGVPPVLSASPLPTGATFTDNGNGSGTFNWTPNDRSAGTYNLTFTAADGDPAYPGDADVADIVITVLDTNRVPSLFVNPLQTKDVNEGGTLNLVCTAWDIDGVAPTVQAFLQAADTLATNMTFTLVPLVADTVRGTLTFTPNFTQGNTNPTKYYLWFVVTDGSDPNMKDTSTTQTINVYNVPQKPVMTFNPNAGPYSIAEGATLQFTVSTVDPDGAGIPLLTAQNVPLNATATVSINTMTFRFTPSFTQAGSYAVRFIAKDVDALGLADTQTVTINVLDGGNQAPQFTGTYPTTVDVFVDVLHQTNLTASDPDGSPVVLSAAPIMTGASFLDNGDGTGRYAILADVGQVGQSATVTFTVSDGVLSSSRQITYTIRNFMRGDADGSLRYALNDVVYLTNYLFRAGVAPTPVQAGDVDMNGSIEVADLVYMINFLYKSGPRPPQ